MSSAQIKLRRDTAANWTSANPILADGEFGYERDTAKAKVGNGVSDWLTLAYLSDAQLSAHLAASNPHPQYLTPVEGDATYDALGSAAAAQAAAALDATSKAAAAQAASTPVAHASNTANPHSVTKAQVGLGSVDNTSDADKPVSTAQGQADTNVLNAAALDATTKANAAAAASTPVAHASATNNPHSVTKAQVGLGSVDNTSDADKPVSTAQQTALAQKQATLVSGTNIMTLNGVSILNSGDLQVGGGIGASTTLFLNNSAAFADNFTLTPTPTGLPETVKSVVCNSGVNAGVTFIERYVSEPLGGTTLEGGIWRFNTFASTTNNTGLNQIVTRVNKRSEVSGVTVTMTGSGATRTLTATGGSPFIPGHATASVLTAALVELPTQTAWVSGYTSPTQVTITLTDSGFVNVTGVALNAIYTLLFSATTGDITGATAALYLVETTQPSFVIAPTDRLVLAYFGKTDSGTNRTIGLYYDGSTHYSNTETPIAQRHNQLGGLNEGEYLHLSTADKTKLDGIEASANNYSHPANHSPSIITQDASNRFVTDTEKATWNGKQAALGFTPENSANKGAVNGYAGLDASGKVPSAQLPSYVDDVLEYANLAAFPATGATGVIYVAIDTNKTYRWSGSAYVYITSGAVDSVNGQTGVVVLGTMSDQAANNVNIDGGTIDGTVIGQNDPRAVHATTLSASGAITLNNAVDLRWKDSAGTPLNVMKIYSDDNLYIDSPTATGNTIFRVAAAEKARLTHTGLAVTGALSATGGVTLTGDAGYASLTSDTTNSGISGAVVLKRSGTVAGYIGLDATNRISLLNAGANQGLYVDSTSGAVSVSNGLAVTGALSATGDITTFNSGSLRLSSGDNTCTYALQNSGSGGNATLSFVQVGVAERGRFDATGLLTLNNGLAVTGALSATGNVNTADAYTYSWGTGTAYVQGSSSAGYVKLATAGGSATLDAAGNIGLGVTPSVWNTSHGQRAIQVGPMAAISSLDAGGANKQVHLANNCYEMTSPKYIAAGGYAQDYMQYNGMHVWKTAPVAAAAGNAVTFVDMMTLDASGNLLVDLAAVSSAPPGGGFCFGSRAHFGYNFVAVGHQSGVASSSEYAVFSYNGSSIGSITQSGTTAVAYNTTSDYRLKTNVRPADAKRFGELEFVDYERIDGRHECGLLAHKLQEIYPDLVVGEKDATEIRTVEIEPAIPAVTEQVLVTEAVFNDDGEEIEPAVYAAVEVTPAVEAITEDQEFPVYQQVNYIGLIPRMGVRIQHLDRVVVEQQAIIESQAQMLALFEKRLALLEAA